MTSAFLLVLVYCLYGFVLLVVVAIVVEYIVFGIKNYRRRLRFMSEARELCAMTDYELKDIGLTRSDVIIILREGKLPD